MVRVIVRLKSGGVQEFKGNYTTAVVYKIDAVRFSDEYEDNLVEYKEAYLGIGEGCNVTTIALRDIEEVETIDIPRR